MKLIGSVQNKLWIAMRIRFLGSESLGVRSLSMYIDADVRKIVIDPGVALGFYRYDLHPHIIQAAFSKLTKVRIVRALRYASDVVITHFHGDHTPLCKANPFQLSVDVVGLSLSSVVHLWTKSFQNMNALELERAQHLMQALNTKAVLVQRSREDCGILLLGPYPHGIEGCKVLAVAVMIGSKTIVDLSDTQLLVDKIIDDVRELDPYIVITSGPPLYRYEGKSKEKILKIAKAIVTKLCNYADYVVVDHHLMRSVDGSRWLDSIREEIGNRVMCVADYYRLPRILLEAWRKVLYELTPIDNTWFLRYGYRGYGEALMLCRRLVEELVKDLPREVTIDLDELRRYLVDLKDHILEIANTMKELNCI